MKLFREYLLLALISGCLGIAVAFPFISLFDINMFEYMLKSCLCGAVIGVSIKTTFIFFFRNVVKRTALSFLIVIGTISVFTYAGSYFMGLRNWKYSLAMTLLAVLVGMVANVVIYRYTIKINTKLKEAQTKIREAREKAPSK